MDDSRREYKVLSVGRFVALAVAAVAVLPVLAKEGPWDTKFMVGNDPHLQIHCAWNAPQRAGGPYASAVWPRGALATERALLFAARQVLREEWKIGQVIAAEHPGGGDCCPTYIEAVIVPEAIRKEGEAELARSSSGLAWSGLAAGLSMGFSLVGAELIRSHLPEASWTPLVAKFGYALGFVIVVLGRQQLFTENTLTAIVPLLRHRTVS